MSEIKRLCVNCGKELKQGAKFCSNCGKAVNDNGKVSKKETKNKKYLAYWIGAIALGVFILIVASFHSQKPEKLILGNWYSANGELIYQFSEDGTASYYNGQESFNYTINEKKDLTFSTWWDSETFVWDAQGKGEEDGTWYVDHNILHINGGTRYRTPDGYEKEAEKEQARIEKNAGKSRAIVCEDERWYIIDENNQKLSEIELEDSFLTDIADMLIIRNALPFNEDGIAHIGISVKDAEGFVVYTDENGNIFPYVAPYLGIEWNCKRGIIIDATEKSGVIDTAGNLIVAPIYESMKAFAENGLAPARKDGYWGYIDTEGKEVISFQYDQADKFSKWGLAPVLIGGRVGVIDEHGKTVINFMYDSIEILDSDLVCVRISDDSGKEKYGLLNAHGEEILPIKFDDITYSNDIIGAVLNEYAYTFDKEGNGMIEVNVINTEIPYTVNTDMEEPYIDNSVYSLGQDRGAVIIEIVDADERTERHKCINAKGEVLWDSGWTPGSICVGVGVIDFQNDLNPVILNETGKFGFINQNGEVIIAPQFDFACPFKGNVAFASQDYYYKLIDKQGNAVIDQQFEHVRNWSSNGLAAVCVGGKWGYINQEGEMVIQPQYDAVTSFADIKE